MRRHTPTEELAGEPRSLGIHSFCPSLSDHTHWQLGAGPETGQLAFLPQIGIHVLAHGLSPDSPEADTEMRAGMLDRKGSPR